MPTALALIASRRSLLRVSAFGFDRYRKESPVKLIGSVNSITRQVAERTRGSDMTREKRGFVIGLKPPTPLSSYYSYGSMNFYLNGIDLEDFPVDLSDTVDVYLVKQGEGGEQFDIENLRHELAVAKNALAKAEEGHAAYKDRYDKLEQASMKHRSEMSAAATVNAQLMAQIEALKLGRADLTPMTMIEG